MSLQEPRWLWLLGLIPLLLWFWRWRAPLQEREVASLFLWKKLSRHLSDAGHRRRLPLSAYFWCAFFAALALALSQPKRITSDEPRVLLLLENSARMQAQLSNGATRFSKLQEKVADFLASLPSCSVTLEVLPDAQPLEDSPAKIASHVKAIAPDSRPCNLRRELYARVSAMRRFDLIVIGSDREIAMPDVAGEANLQKILVGAPSNNVGWVGLTRTDAGYAAIVKNFSQQRQTRKFEIWSGGVAVSQRSLDLAPGEAREILVAETQFPEGTTPELRLVPQDELALDDRLFLDELPQEMRVRIPADLPEAFLRAFAAIGQLRAIEAQGATPLPGEAELYLRDRPQGDSSPALVFHAQGEVFVPQVLRANPENALGRHLDFAGVELAQAWRVTSTMEQPIAWAREEQGKDWPILWSEGEDLHIAFDVAKSDWPKHPSFPVFWAAWVQQIREQRSHGRNLLHSESSDTNGIASDMSDRSVGWSVFSAGKAQPRESFSDLALALACLFFILAGFLEWRGR